MPQFDLSVYSSQIFWLVICFTILTVYIAKISVPRLKQVLEVRWRKTDGYRIEAAKFADEEKTIESENAKRLAEIRKEAHDMIAETTLLVNRNANDKKLQVIADIKRQMSATEATISTEKEKVLGEIRSFTEEITGEAIHKVLPTGVSKEAVAKVLDDKLSLKVANGG